MKVIVCTGDSHTCGQGADSIKSAQKPKYPNTVYNTAGKGIGVTCVDLKDPSYVNLLRQYVQEHTGSTSAVQTSEQLCQKYGFAGVNYCEGMDITFCRVDGEMVIDVQKWDMLLLCVAEREEEAKLDIYLDGRLSKTETLVTPLGRYTGYSYRYVTIPCADAKEVKLVPVSGKPHLRYIQFAAGEYVLINSGVGSCTTKRYVEECLPYCIDALQPDILVAEGQTINDWINYATAQEHYDWLKKLMETLQTGDRKLMFCTVSPILGPQANNTGVLYQDFIDASRKLAKDLNLVTADAHAAFEAQMAGMDEQQRNDFMYVDRWHVNGKGHKIYADTIWEKLKDML